MANAEKDGKTSSPPTSAADSSSAPTTVKTEPNVKVTASGGAKTAAASSVATTVKATRPPISKPTVTITSKASSSAPVAVTKVPSLRAAVAKSKKKKASPAVTMAPAPVPPSAEKGGAQGENVGRWTAEEHRLFLQGLEQHGKGWKKIASLIKTRSVVQIRTHAQKYFQKLAKARQNGEEGDVTMEGRGGVSSVTSVSTAVAAHTSKRRRQTTGTKRKAIHSVVVSAQRQGKKQAITAGDGTAPSLPAIAPTLAHFVLPTAKNASGKGSKRSGGPSISTSQGPISGPAVEDSIFRFLTPAPVLPMEAQVNDVARQAGANPITLPSDNPSATPTITGGEVSPTGVPDLSIYPSWTDAKDTPSWYAKGADVDALLDVGDSLDWLADTGDLNETYQPPPESSTSMPDIEDAANGSGGDLGQPGAANNSSVSTLPHVDSNVETVVPPLPSLFDGTESGTTEKKSLSPSASAAELKSAPEVTASEDHLEVFENCEEEHEFVSAILETNDSATSLPALN